MTEQKKEAVAKVEMPEKNGIREPKPGTACAKIWVKAGEMSQAIGGPVAVGDLIATLSNEGFNEATIKTQYARWRKYHGVEGRVESEAAKAKKAERAESKAAKLAEKEEAKAKREEAKAAKKAEREAAKAQREADKAAKAEAKATAKAEKEAEKARKAEEKAAEKARKESEKAEASDAE